MPSVRRKRLYESFFRGSSKHSSSKGYERQSSYSSMMDLDLSQSERDNDTKNSSLAEQRRRRIYEAEFKRPYPVTPNTTTQQNNNNKKSLLQYLGVTPPASPKVPTPPGTPKKKKKNILALASKKLSPSRKRIPNNKSGPAREEDTCDKTPAPKTQWLAYDMQPCDSWDVTRKTSLPKTLVRQVTPATSMTSTSGSRMCSTATTSPIEDDINLSWISTERKETTTPQVIDVLVDMKPCNFWEGSQSSSIPPRELLLRDDDEETWPTAKTPSPRPVVTSGEQGRNRVMLYSPPVAEISRDTTEDEEMGHEDDDESEYDLVNENDVIMKVTPPSPHSKGIPNPFDISPLTYYPSEFQEPPDQKEAPLTLAQPLLNEVEGMQNHSMEASFSFSVQEEPAFESDVSLQQFMKISEEEHLQLYVDDIQEPTFDRIIESLYGNTSLTTVTIVRSAAPVVGDYRTPQEMKCLWDAIRCLPNLKFLVVINIRTDVLNDLADIVPTFPGSKFQLHMAEGTPTERFLKALAKAPKLKHVQIHGDESMDIGILLESESLLHFRIISQKFQFDDHHMQLFADRLARNESKIQKIDLEPTLSTNSMTGLAYALRYNRTLKSLRLSYNHSLGDSNAVVEEVSTMLHYNCTLLELTNYCHESIWVSGETKDDLMNALKRNGIITLFKFFQEEPMFFVAKESVLKINKGGKSARGRAGQIAAMFEKYWNCGSLMDIQLGCDIRLPK